MCNDIFFTKIKYNFRAEQRVSSNLIGRAVSSQRGGLKNEFFSYLEDITVSPGYLKGWGIFKMTAVTLGP